RLGPIHGGVRSALRGPFAPDPRKSLPDEVFADDSSQCSCVRQYLPWIDVRGVHPQARCPHYFIRNGDIYHTSRRSRRTMMTRPNSPSGEAGRPFILPVTARWTTSVRRHSRTLVSPLCRP